MGVKEELKMGVKVGVKMGVKVGEKVGEKVEVNEPWLMEDNYVETVCRGELWKLNFSSDSAE